MIIPCLVGLAVLIGLLTLYIALKPAEFRISRSATFSAPPSIVFEEVNDFHRWQAWSPWAKLDPNAKHTYAGPTAGPGASFMWDGNQKVGAGKMTVTTSRPDELILIKLEFFKPFQATHTTEFTFKPAGSGTLLTWSMSGKNSFVAKAMCLVMSCDKMIGGQFERGFANLRAVVDAEMVVKI